MRIAFIGQKGIPSISGGVENHVEELSVRLASFGHEVYAYTRPNYSDKCLLEYKGVKLINLGNLKTKHLDAISHTLLACFDVSFRRKVDIIHFHSIGPSSLIWLVKLLNPRTPVIGTFHTQCYMHQKWGLLAKSYLKFGEYVCCNMADSVITVSRTLKQYAEKKYGRKMHYIPNGVGLPTILPASRIKSWGLEKDSYILAVSRLVRHKGLHYLIDAYKQIDTRKKLVIVGDGSYTDAYVNEIKESASTDKNIIFTGMQKGVPLMELLSNAFCFVQPSESEGLSIALLEAMSYAKPIIASDIPENKEALVDAGFYFKNGDASDLAEKLRHMLAHPAENEIKAAQARKRAIEFYNWEDITAQIEALYKNALELKRGGKLFDDTVAIKNRIS